MTICNSYKLGLKESKYALNGIRKQLLADQILG